MTKPPLPKLAEFGPLNSLWVQVRRMYPQMLATLVRAPEGHPSREEGEPAEYLRVTYRNAGPWRIVWDQDIDAARWNSGPHIGKVLGRRNQHELSASTIATMLGVIR